MNATKFLEIETKYRADDIKLKDFDELARSMNPETVIKSGSYDYYFVKDENTFLRYREGVRPELTMKQKSKDANNWIRTELNLPLDPDVSTKEMFDIVSKFCEMLGFNHNFTIFKAYSVYIWPDHNTVYYVVYDHELSEKSRFIEIEMSESKNWTSQEEAWEALGKIEKLYEPVGLSPQRRTKKSLFEMFRKLDVSKT